MVNQLFYPTNTFPELDILSDPINFKTIQQEYRNFVHSQQEYDWPERELYESNKEWKVIPIYGFGIWAHEKHFPVLVSLLKSIPTMKTAIFSKLGPYCTTDMHQGWKSLSNHVLRCHLGISVPELSKGRTGVGMLGKFSQSRLGQWTIFDDSYKHCGVNETDEERIVLIVDMKRPKTAPPGISMVEDSPELMKFVNKFKSKK